MAILDFIKNRNARPQQAVAEKPQEQKPETAKQMYTREASQEKLTPMANMSADQQAKLDGVRERLQAATQHIGNAHSPSVPAEASSSPEATRQNANAQDKNAPALSPTSGGAGQPATEKQQQQPQKSADRSKGQTIARPRASWER